MTRREYVGRNILAEMARRGITPGEMALIMGHSTSTFYRRMRHPEDLTIEDLDSAAAAFRIPVETLLKKGV